jgi:hypothetical protein
MSNRRTLLIVGSGISRQQIDQRILQRYDTWYIHTDEPPPSDENYDIIQTIGIDTKTEAEKLPLWYYSKFSFNLSPWFGLRQEQRTQYLLQNKD